MSITKKLIRTCPHRKCVRIFERNFVPRQGKNPQAGWRPARIFNAVMGKIRRKDVRRCLCGQVLIIMQLLMFIISGNGCAKGESIIADSESNVPTTETVFEPIPVPEGGWTMEELAKTIRINGIPFSYPLTLGSLSDEYRFVDADHDPVTESVESGFIEYKGTLIACVGFEMNSQNTDNYSKKVREIMTVEDEENPKYNSAFTINGIGHGASPEDVERVLGTPDESGIDETGGGILTYYENGEDKYFLRMCFFNKKLNLMRFCFREN